MSKMIRSVYIETSVVSYLTARPSNNVIRSACQQINQAWWESGRTVVSSYISPYVVEEASAGDPLAAAERIEALRTIPVLPVTDEIPQLAEFLLLAANVSLNNITMIWLLTPKLLRRIVELWGFGWWIEPVDFVGASSESVGKLWAAGMLSIVYPHGSARTGPQDASIKSTGYLYSPGGFGHSDAFAGLRQAGNSLLAVGKLTINAKNFVILHKPIRLVFGNNFFRWLDRDKC